jgi:cellulose synthase/poly-beta-1,6-N-acetylglucosamine synthase-like glycosyltransferase/peptidoglycan/xylan/chitin deacetylase (PgdA/CDA1 family)
VENLAIGEPAVRAAFVQNLASRVARMKAGGLLIDFEQIDPAYNDPMSEFYEEIATALHAAGCELWLSVPMGEDFDSLDVDRLSTAVDRFVAVLHDENSDSDSPGPIASREWFEGWLETAADYGRPEQWIAALGCYGYDWTEGRRKAQTIAFSDAMCRADYAGLSGLSTSGPLFEPNFVFRDEIGANHTVWFLDAVTFANQLSLVRAQGFGGIAISRLGLEDQGVWQVLRMPEKITTSDLAILSRIDPGEEVGDVGIGSIVSLGNEREVGARTVTMDDKGSLQVTYTEFPSYTTLYRQGSDPSGHKVVLSFDDGPDPKYTPQILDILKRENVKATFFLVGSRAELYPDLVRRIVREGHEIGNHTYTHPNVGLIPESQVKVELNATQRLIEAICGRSTTLFRPPYNADANPNKAEEIQPLLLAQDLGYWIALEDIDTEDWSRPGVAKILERVRNGRVEGGNIVLLHDAGGNREQTVEALPEIIEYLRNRGDETALISNLLGKSRDDVMPEATDGGQYYYRFVSGTGFRVFHTVETFAWALLLVATGLVLIRTVLLIWLASRFRGLPIGAPEIEPPLTVLIAAYNEAKVIAATIRSVLDTDYLGPIELIVVNDGSRDETASIVRDIAASDDRVRLIDQQNTGKAGALTRGFAAAQHGIVVLLDADTQFLRDTLRQLVQPFQDERVGAVSGHARVGNLRSFIARCQDLEYICGFNLDRRAYARWNCITVAPGAISAIRMSAYREVGGLSHDTLAEDTDLTLSLHRARWRVAYAPHAVAFTEAPETLAALAKQRFRWAYGTMQCLWKHRDMVLNPRFGALGFFSLPSIWFFQIFLVALTPMVDFGLLVSLLLGNGAAALPYFLVFLVVDFLLAVLACRLEDEPLWKSWIILPMRIIYRVLLSWVVWKAIRRAFQGVMVAWGKLDRTATVQTRSA